MRQKFNEKLKCKYISKYCELRDSPKFLGGCFYGYYKYLKSFSIQLYKPTKEIHEMQVPKYDLQEIITAKKFEPNLPVVF